jgi:hypothetical protein
MPYVNCVVVDVEVSVMITSVELSSSVEFSRGRSADESDDGPSSEPPYEPP